MIARCIPPFLEFSSIAWGCVNVKWVRVKHEWERNPEIIEQCTYSVLFFNLANLLCEQVIHNMISDEMETIIKVRLLRSFSSLSCLFYCIYISFFVHLPLYSFIQLSKLLFSSVPRICMLSLPSRGRENGTKTVRELT